MFLRKLTLIFLLLPLGLTVNAQGNSSSVTLYTPYTKISVPPGQSVDYSISVVNNGDKILRLDVSVWGLSEKWDYRLKSGGLNIKQISVLPKTKQVLSLKLQVPLKINKGNYRFYFVAGTQKLPLTINVSKKGTYNTLFTSDQKNMQGDSKQTFTFRTSLKNRTAETQLYSLRAEAPAGWRVVFKPDYHQATSVEIKPNETKNVMVQVNPPEFVKAGTYKIPVYAVTQNTSAQMVLEVVITGTYDLKLTTPTGLLSGSVTVGGQKKITLDVRNTGSAALKQVKLTASYPPGWDVTFKPKSINRIEPGRQTRVTATVKAGKKAIPGDYLVVFRAHTPEVSAKAQYRIMVKTSMLWGWVGVLIILAAIAFIVFLFRKYGRR